MTETADPRRTIRLEGLFNFRDLGGYHTHDGRRTKWRRLFRSDALFRASASDVATFETLGITTAIDLRSPSEIAFTGRGLLAASSLTFVEVMAGDPHDELEAFHAGALDDRYLHYLTTHGPGFAHALELLSDPRSAPTVISCFFGKDRTGVLSALILDCVGVSKEHIAEDYALSATPVAAMVARLRADELYAAALDDTAPERLDARKGTMLSFLGSLERTYGGGAQWARQAGLNDDQLRSLRASLTELEGPRDR